MTDEIPNADEAPTPLRSPLVEATLEQLEYYIDEQLVDGALMISCKRGLPAKVGITARDEGHALELLDRLGRAIARRFECHAGALSEVSEALDD